MPSIYKTDEGRRAMAQWYDRFVNELGADRVESREVSTRYGHTNILMVGPRDAPPLWCFHGAMGSAPAALYQVPELTQRFRIHFPDTVGQPGRSSDTRLDWQGDDHGHWVLDVLDAVGEEAITAMGVSLGGYVVLRAAAIAPERIRKAVLWVPGGLIKPSTMGMAGLMMSGLLYALLPSRARLERVLARTCTDLDDTYVEFFADSLRHVHADRRFPSTLPDGALSSWNARVMLITHELDTVFPADPLVARAKALIPGLERVETMKGWSHVPPFAPGALDPLLERVERFVKSPNNPQQS